jgi:putative transposase
VAHGRECLFGQVVDAKMQLNQFGQIVQHAWLDLPNHYPYVELGAVCIMPNHVHAVILLNDGRGGSIVQISDSGQARIMPDNISMQIQADPPLRPTAHHPLSEIVRALKSFSARRINILRKTPGIPVWQRNYYEHIIRNNDDHTRIQFYIESNPINWAEDKENPEKM